MVKGAGHIGKLVGRGDESKGDLPEPTRRYRRRAWLEFQRALDPLAPPRELPMRPRD